MLSSTVLAFVNQDQVETKLCLDRAMHLTHGRAEDDSVKLRHHLAWAEHAQHARLRGRRADGMSLSHCTEGRGAALCLNLKLEIGAGRFRFDQQVRDTRPRWT